jgi:hypothetical protein
MCCVLFGCLYIVERPLLLLLPYYSLYFCSDYWSNDVYCCHDFLPASYACRQLPQYPLLPEAHFHWLAILGAQPRVPQNPEVVVYDCSADTSGLPREMAYFYTKLTQLVLSVSPSDSSSGQRVCDVCALLSRDKGLQELVGYLCRFVFVQIRRNLRNIHILQALLLVINSLVLNPHLKLEGCLHQLLPSLLSCIVGAKIGESSAATSTSEYKHYLHTHTQFPVTNMGMGCSVSAWSDLTPLHIRNFGACVVQAVIARFGTTFPDLLPRVCKTYLQAASSSFSSSAAHSRQSSSSSAPVLSSANAAAAVRYGGIVGLGMLGERVISEVLLPNIGGILLNSIEVNLQQEGGGGGEKKPFGSLATEARSNANTCEEFLVVAIINWYIRKSMKAIPSLGFLDFLQTKVKNVSHNSSHSSSEEQQQQQQRKRRRIDSVGDSSAHDQMNSALDQLVDRNVERFVPHYVASSANLQYCTSLFI